MIWGVCVSMCRSKRRWESSRNLYNRIMRNCTPRWTLRSHRPSIATTPRKPLTVLLTSLQSKSPLFYLTPSISLTAQRVLSLTPQANKITWTNSPIRNSYWKRKSSILILNRFSQGWNICISRISFIVIWNFRIYFLLRIGRVRLGILVSRRLYPPSTFYVYIHSQSSIKDTCCIGSPLYMSPESYLQNFYSLKSDIWSFGVLMFEMIYGNPPLRNCPTHDSLKEEIKIPINLKKF